MEEQQVACEEGCLWASEPVIHSGKDRLGEGKEREGWGGGSLDPRTRTACPIRPPGLPKVYQSPEGFQQQAFQARVLVKTRH